MNENHQRHLLSTFQHVDNLLSEAEHILISAGSPSPFQEYSQDSTPIQRKVTHDYIVRVRETMRRILEELEIPLKRPISGAIWAARSHLSFASIAIGEIEPKQMAGYGKVSDEDEQALNKIVAELNAVLNRLGVYLAQGTDADLQSRLQRLEQTKDEVKLLRELERIITAHGLIEFRASLSLLLDRLETNAFEIGVFGRVSSGKSSLLNHLLGGEFLPVGVTPVTALPTRISFGSQPQATVEFAESKPQIIELSRLAEFSTGQQNPANVKHVTRIHVQIPAARLREGVTFVDTPGLGSLATSGAEETVAYLPRCDLGIVLLDAGAALTHEDLAVVQSLYQSGALAMVLVSKSDLLTPADRERTVEYIRQHLLSEVNLDLPVHLVSIVGADARFCDEWLAHELKPLLDSHREAATVSLKRKIGGLSEAVERTLQARFENVRSPMPPQSGEQLKQANEAFRNADAILEAAQHESRDIADGIRSLAEEIIDAAAEDIAAAWNQAGEKPAGAADIFPASLSRLVAAQNAKCMDALVKIRDQLAQTLRLAHQASRAKREPEELPKLSGLPVIDPISVSRVVRLKRPVLLCIFGKAVLRNYVRRRLKQQTAEALSDFLNFTGRRLEQWHRKTLAELQEAFAAGEGIYRIQFEQSQSASSSESGGPDVQADLHALREW
jgi:GTP-binding protein EngB required for normal cell division/enamine deaminase RidA (YjgF/YER057c/UK114 family)